MKHLLKDANGVGNYTPYVDYSGSTITFQNTIWNKVKRNLVLWYDIKRQGATNESMSQNPILKDLSGHGHDATCYNFAWSGMSGIGGFVYDESNLNRGFSNIIISGNKATFTGDVQTTGGALYVFGVRITGEVGETLNIKVPSFKVKIEGLPEGKRLNVNLERGTDSGGTPSYTFLTYLQNGINEVPEVDITLVPNTEEDYCYCLPLRITSRDELIGESLIGVTIEILPLYPNALVSDGVDDYCRVDGLPILTDYTVIAKRKRLDIDLGNRGALASKRFGGGSTDGAFAFEFSSADNVTLAISFGTFNGINFEKTDISYQTKNYYNGVNIQSGNHLDTNHLTLFSIREDSGCAQAALYSFVLFNRTLTDEEIEWVKKSLIEG